MTAFVARSRSSSLRRCRRCRRAGPPETGCLLGLPVLGVRQLGGRDVCVGGQSPGLGPAGGRGSVIDYDCSPSNVELMETNAELMGN